MTLLLETQIDLLKFQIDLVGLDENHSEVIASGVTNNHWRCSVGQSVPKIGKKRVEQQ